MEQESEVYSALSKAAHQRIDEIAEYEMDLIDLWLEEQLKWSEKEYELQVRFGSKAIFYKIMAKAFEVTMNNGISNLSKFVDELPDKLESDKKYEWNLLSSS